MWATWARAWALALLVAALAGSGLIRGNRGAHEPWLPGAAVAATATALPTATSTPQATRPAHIHPLASPTPVAALPGETLSTN